MQPELAQESIQKKIASVRSWYHVIDLGSGVLTPGAYDMRPDLGKYPFPDVRGRDVLDVGVSNGFFAFEFERRGARRVVGTELRSIDDHDIPFWLRREIEPSLRDPKVRSDLEHHEVHGGFRVAKEILDSNVEVTFTRIYDLPRHFDAVFDFAFCGNVLIHLRDPVGALEGIHQVMKPGATLVVTTSIDLARPYDNYGVLVGNAHACSWWMLSPAALVQCCKMAGFENVHYHTEFELESTRPPHNKQTIGIVSCQAR